MNRSEIAEIRRRFNAERNGITSVRGCYVNEKKEIVASFERPLQTFPQEEKEKYLALMRRTLSGIPGKNLVDVAFSNQEVMEGDAHRLLMNLKDSGLKDEALVQQLFQKIIDSLVIEDHYLILMMHDVYDVPYRATDGAKLEDASQEVFSYILVSICPVKLTKPALSYNAFDKEFHSRNSDWVVTAPEMGFLFPSFDERASNIYNALYYTKDTENQHDELAEALFHSPLPMPAALQKETFQSILADTLAEDCSMEVVQAVHEQVCSLIEERKQDKTAPQAAVSQREVKAVLESCGVKEEHVAAFAQQFDDAFGSGMTVNAQNIINDKKFEVRTADVVIQVNPARSDLVETRTIDGFRYILIRADEGVAVNGVNINIASAEAAPSDDSAPW